MFQGPLTIAKALAAWIRNATKALGELLLASSQQQPGGTVSVATTTLQIQAAWDALLATIPRHIFQACYPIAPGPGQADGSQLKMLLGPSLFNEAQVRKAEKALVSFRKCTGVVRQPPKTQATRNMAFRARQARVQRSGIPSAPQRASFAGARGSSAAPATFATTVPAVPYVIYMDAPDSWSSPQDIANTVISAVTAGFNCINLCFWISSAPEDPSGATDMCDAWQSIGASLQISTMATVHAAGAVVLACASGSTDYPWNNLSAQDYGSYVATWAVENYLDGVDFDMENYQLGYIMYTGSTTQDAVNYQVEAITAAQAVLASAAREGTYTGAGIVTAVPEAPYFGPVNPSDATAYWAGELGGFTSVYLALQEGGNALNWVNVQFYNQGASMYSTYASLFTSNVSGSAFPGTAVAQIASYGVPLYSIVVAQVLQASYCTNGYVAPSTLGGWIETAKSQYLYKGGVAVWQYPAVSLGGGGESQAATWLQQLQAGET